MTNISRPIREKILSRGFTLVEILVYTAVVGIFLLAISGFLYWGLRLNQKSQALQETYDSARAVLETMGSEIRNAKSIYTPTTTASQLSLETATQVPAGEPSAYIDFFLCGSRVCLKREGQSAVAMTPDAVDITGLMVTPVITGNNVQSVNINLEASYKNPQNKPELEASFSVGAVFSIRSY